jgi:hypothetical protein
MHGRVGDRFVLDSDLVPHSVSNAGEQAGLHPPPDIEHDLVVPNSRMTGRLFDLDEIRQPVSIDVENFR